MALNPGARIGPYEILALLGAGGMGEVYRALDTNLKRQVALKVLPASVAGDAERLARFQREAEILAALNHSNIAHIHGLERADGTIALVMELVEGPTLADRITRGSLSIAEALPIAKQIAEALETAHAKGIIHRDLKPANIKVTPDGTVKVLDFGLAKIIEPPGARRDVSQLPTVTSAAMTQAGVVLGTAAYMSPEQARGQVVDQRTDIWAFGCVLYEMLTRRRAFAADTASESIAKVLEREPDWDVLPPATPVNVRALLRRCLQKDLSKRLHDMADGRVELEDALAPHATSRTLLRGSMVGGTLVFAIAVLAVWWLRTPSRPADRSQWVQLTNLPDSASQPALSPDGRMLAFVRGPSTFQGPGQIYAKVLPDGEPVQLTNDRLNKMSPVFSPDGARIAYTTIDQQFHWDTWVVSVPGGGPQPWLRNASGLVWANPREVLFSEIKTETGLHMGIVAADENRGHERDVYLPPNDRAMAHRSYISPNGKWVLLVEMDKDGLWGPCRVVSIDGGSPGRQVGPLGAGCTFGAWSPDGKWIYVTSTAGGLHHIWRQRFPDGPLEQVTSGPTEEEGVAMASDGHSFVTAMALQAGSVWMHDAAGDRQISLEGIGAYPRLSRDGHILAYLVQKTAPVPGSLREPGDVWVANVVSGRSQPLAPGMHALNYDLAPDGQQVVMEVVDREGKPRLWLAPVDRGTPVRAIPNVEGREPLFAPSGDVFFRRAEGTSGFIYRVHPDGTGLRKALDHPVDILEEISPDERWIEGYAARSKGGAANQLFPLDNGPPISPGLAWVWGHSDKLLAISGLPIASGRTYVMPIVNTEQLLELARVGFRSEEQIARLPRARRIDASWVVPGPSPEEYAFYRGTTQRNIYRIPIQ